MAHALHRVSLSTARPVDAQFAFVSHNPGSAVVRLYCHVFRARHARAVRDVRGAFALITICYSFGCCFTYTHIPKNQEKHCFRNYEGVETVTVIQLDGTK